MKRSVFGLIASLALATAFVAAQGTTQTPPAQGSLTPQTSTDQTKKAADVDVTGCVIQGTAPTTFLLDNAKLDPANAEEKGKTYVLVAGSTDVDLKTHLNHQVKVTGIAENKVPPVPPAGEKVAEKDLPRFTAKAATMVSDRCTPAGS
jgi:hypothetical protein